MCLHIAIFLFIPQPKLTMARCRRNVDNFLEACRKIGVEEVGANGHCCFVLSMLTCRLAPFTASFQEPSEVTAVNFKLKSYLTKYPNLMFTFSTMLYAYTWNFSLCYFCECFRHAFWHTSWWLVFKCFICDYLGETSKQQELTKCNHICWKNVASQTDGNKLSPRELYFHVFPFILSKYSKIQLTIY